MEPEPCEFATQFVYDLYWRVEETADVIAQRTESASDFECQLVRSYNRCNSKDFDVTDDASLIVACRQEDVSIEDVVMEGRLLLESLKLQAEVKGLRVISM